MLRPLLWLLLLALGSSVSVTFDHRSMIINGTRKLLIGGCIHYPRSTPQMWPDLLQKAKDGGVDVIETYVFWNAHEPQKGAYDFNGGLDLIGYLNAVQQAGLYVTLRIGPYVCAEWNYGGFPEWLREIQNITFRTNNQPFLNEMKAWVDYLVNYLKSNNVFAVQGGPVIMAQIENEYGNVEIAYGEGGKEYVEWCANYAESLEIGVPWIMCQQPDAPPPIINTCNGFYCDGFTPASPDSPAMWTENWAGWLQDWGQSVPRRPVEDLAYSVLRFVARGGSMVTYYMYHGGTNFGRTAGGPGIITSYDYDTAIDEYGLVHEPKYSHLKHMHVYLHQAQELILSNPEAQAQSLGTDLEAHVYGTLGSSDCVAFLSNVGRQDASGVKFNNNIYDIPGWSVSILTSCTTAVFNSAQVVPPSSLSTPSTISSELELPIAPSAAAAAADDNVTDIPVNSWSWWPDVVGGLGWSTPVIAPQPLEQISTTHDTTDYLWYETAYVADTTVNTSIKLTDTFDYFHVFVNGQHLGSSSIPDASFSCTLTSGPNRISVLVETLGLINFGFYLERHRRGILGTVEVDGKDITMSQWNHTVGLLGEQLGVWTPNGVNQVSWTNNSVTSANNRPLTWFKSVFDLSTSTLSSGLPLSLNLTGMSKGFIFLNGINLGRHYSSSLGTLPPCSPCDYKGRFEMGKCRVGCGEPSLPWYHLPREYLQPTNNLLVILEESSGNPSSISIIQRQLGVVCAINGESPAPPPVMDELNAVLMCSDGQKITRIDFASFGTPAGVCRRFTQGSCHSTKSTSVVTTLCLNKSSCNIPVTSVLFGDPCPDTAKTLKVQVTCS